MREYGDIDFPSTYMYEERLVMKELGLLQLAAPTPNSLSVECSGDHVRL